MIIVCPVGKTKAVEWREEGREGEREEGCQNTNVEIGACLSSLSAVINWMAAGSLSTERERERAKEREEREREAAAQTLVARTSVGTVQSAPQDEGGGGGGGQVRWRSPLREMIVSSSVNGAATVSIGDDDDDTCPPPPQPPPPSCLSGWMCACASVWVAHERESFPPSQRRGERRGRESIVNVQENECELGKRSCRSANVWMNKDSKRRRPAARVSLGAALRPVSKWIDSLRESSSALFQSLASCLAAG